LIDKFGHHILSTWRPDEPFIFSVDSQPPPPLIPMALTKGLKREHSGGDFDVEDHRIKRLGPPHDDLDAVNLAKVKELLKRERQITVAEFDILKMDIAQQLEKLQKRKPAAPVRGPRGPPGVMGPPGPPGEGFHVTPDGHYNMLDKKLQLVHDPVEEGDAVNLKILNQRLASGATSLDELRKRLNEHHAAIQGILENLLARQANEDDESEDAATDTNA